MAIAKTANGVTRFNVSKKLFAELEIPIPPMEIQSRIVSILDTFSAAIENLKQQIAERKKQYEYYRNNLFEFKEGECEWKKLREVFMRIKGTPITAGKMKEIATPTGSVRIFAGGKTIIDANEADIPNANITKVPSVIVQSRGVIDVVYYDKPFTFKNEMWAYTTDNKTTVKYLYYVMKSNIQTFRDAASGMGSMPQISLCVTENFEIPIPPLEIQNEIVRILDKFSSLEEELEQKLGEELVLRKKQYEYYRDKLLTFGDEVEWKTLGEITNKITDGMHNLPKCVQENTGYPVVSAQNINNGTIDYITNKYVTEFSCVRAIGILLFQ